MNVSDLQQPVPDQTAPRERKEGYRAYAIDTKSSEQQEQLVDIADYGIAGQSYYSRPNGGTGDAVPGVPKHIYVRKGIAERLAAINDAVKQSALLTDLFGGPVELYVDEGLRSQKIQRLLYEEVFPRLIRSRFPTMSEANVLARRSQMVAAPVTDETSPSPHSTGAAVDLKLRYAQSTKDFVPKTEVFMGHADADISNTARPDAFEQKIVRSENAKLAQRNRRIFYWIMRGALNGYDSRLAVNPNEWWHWSYGDQMWAATTGAARAVYGMAPSKR